jgi:hypothetical protein
MPDGITTLPESEDKARCSPTKTELVWARIERRHYEIGVGAGFLSELGRQSTEWGSAEDLGIFVEWIGDRLTELCDAVTADFKEYAGPKETGS